jgi:hypothetical protein
MYRERACQAGSLNMRVQIPLVDNVVLGFSHAYIVSCFPEPHFIHFFRNYTFLTQITNDYKFLT